MVERFQDVGKDLSGFTIAAGRKQLFTAVRLCQIPRIRTAPATGLFGAAGQSSGFAGHTEEVEEQVDGVPKIHRIGITGVQGVVDGVQQIGQFPAGDGPGLMRVLIVFIIEVAHKAIVPLAMGPGQGVPLAGRQAGPEHGGQGGMEAEEGRADARNALSFDQGGGFQLAAQAGPEVFTQFRDGKQVVFKRPALEHPQTADGMALCFAQTFQREFQRSDQAKRRAFISDARYGLLAQELFQTLAKRLGGAGL